jgi:hypothetical protein
MSNETEQLVAAIFHAERSAAKKARGNHRRVDAEKLARSIAERLARDRDGDGGRQS